MNDPITILLLTVLIALVGFLGNRLFNRLDAVNGRLVELCIDHGQRITRLESK